MFTKAEFCYPTGKPVSMLLVFPMDVYNLTSSRKVAPKPLQQDAPLPLLSKNTVHPLTAANVCCDTKVNSGWGILSFKM